MAKLDLKETLNASLTKTKLYIDTELAKKANSSHGTHVTYASIVPKANGTAAVGTSTKVAREDHVHPLQTTVSGNAGSATKLQNAKNIVIGNKTNSFDGTQNITYTLADIGAVSQTDVNNTIKNKFIVLTQAEYNALTTKTTDAIYFIKA